MQQILTYAFLVIYTVTILGIVLVIITDNRNPLKTLPWIIVLVFAPVVGLVFYFFFGQNLSKQRIISRRTRKRITMQLEEALDDGRPDIPDEHLPLARLLAATIHSVPLYGSRITPYTDGKSKMEALLAEIARAKHHIHIQYYILNDDETGRRLRDALIAKAREGVEVRILYDDVGCSGVKKSFFEGMRREGIEAFAFLHVKFPLFTSKVNYRNHRKIAVFDGRVGYVGGMNIALRYVKGLGAQAWRDTMVRIHGNVVYGLQRAFLVDWFFVDRTLITDRRYYPEFPLPQTECLAQVVTSNPIDPWPKIEQGFVRVIHSARQYVYIETPYFLPTEPVLFALRTAALSGVDVRLMIPRKADSKFVAWASRSFVKEIADAGVRVLFYDRGFNHSKLLVSDDLLATIGSTNVDFRSFEHDFESNVFFYDQAMALRVKQVFLDDEADSIPLDQLREGASRGLLLRLWESLVRLMSPLM